MWGVKFLIKTLQYRKYFSIIYFIPYCSGKVSVYISNAYGVALNWVEQHY